MLVLLGQWIICDFRPCLLSSHTMHFVSTGGRIRETVRVKGNEWGRVGVRSEEERGRKKGRLIMKVFQIASPWRSGGLERLQGLRSV